MKLESNGDAPEVRERAQELEASVVIDDPAVLGVILLS